MMDLLIRVFQADAERYPNDGAKLSPAECEHILGELEARVEYYRERLADEAAAPDLLEIVGPHLAGLEYLTEKIRAGTEPKPTLLN